jgi:hypothetical protein
MIDKPHRHGPDAHNFCMLCLQKKRANRPSASTLLHHPFLLGKAAAAVVPGFTRAAGGAVTTGDRGPMMLGPDTSSEGVSIRSESDLLPF